MIGDININEVVNALLWVVSMYLSASVIDGLLTGRCARSKAKSAAQLLKYIDAAGRILGSAMY